MRIVRNKVPSPNFWRGREGNRVDGVVLHIAEGSYKSALSWLTNPKSQVSAHYLVGYRTPGELCITQLVDENDSAWANGKVVSPRWQRIPVPYNRNDKRHNPNTYTISIEVALRTAKEMPTPALWMAVADLVQEICERHSIPIGYQLATRGIVNHNEINAAKTCPGWWMRRFYIVTFIKTKKGRKLMQKKTAMSLTIQGWIAGLLLAFLKWAGIHVGNDAVDAFVQVALALYAAIGVYWGRYRKGDIYWWGGRRA